MLAVAQGFQAFRALDAQGWQGCVPARLKSGP